MEKILYIIIFTVIIVCLLNMIYPVCKQNDKQTEHMATEYVDTQNTNDIKVTVNLDKYEDDYYDPYYYDNGCRSYGCKRRRFWFGDTPFIWNNATRWPKYPYYAGIYDWYRDTYALPYYWYNLY